MADFKELNASVLLFIVFDLYNHIDVFTSSKLTIRPPAVARVGVRARAWGGGAVRWRNSGGTEQGRARAPAGVRQPVPQTAREPGPQGRGRRGL